MYRGRADLSDCRPCLLFIGLLVLSTFLYRCKKPELNREGNLATAGWNDLRILRQKGLCALSVFADGVCLCCRACPDPGRQQYLDC